MSATQGRLDEHPQRPGIHCTRCGGVCGDPTGLGPCMLCHGTGRHPPPTLEERVAQLQRQRDAALTMLRVLHDAIGAGLHLTYRSPLMRQAEDVLEGRA